MNRIWIGPESTAYACVPICAGELAVFYPLLWWTWPVVQQHTLSLLKEHNFTCSLACSTAGSSPMSILFADVSFLGKFTQRCVTWNINYVCTALNQFWQGPEHKTALPHTLTWLCLPAGQLTGAGCAGCSLFCVCLLVSERDTVYL